MPAPVVSLSPQPSLSSPLGEHRGQRGGRASISLSLVTPRFCHRVTNGTAQLWQNQLCLFLCWPGWDPTGFGTCVMLKQQGGNCIYLRAGVSLTPKQSR